MRTGTGRAPPKKKAPLEAYQSIAGTRMVTQGSMWGSGFSVSRPASKAVPSPCLSAA